MGHKHGREVLTNPVMLNTDLTDFMHMVNDICHCGTL